VSEVKDLILRDLVRYTLEMEHDLQQMMEHLLARQKEAAAQIAANQEEMKAHEGKVNAETKALLKQLNEDIEGHMEDLREGLRSCGRKTTGCQVSSLACPDKSKSA
jgi:leucyl aminopeptidase (aminopeptidase T)